MAPNPRRLDERLDALYAELPTIKCGGYCQDSCGPVEMSVRERQRIEAKHGEVTCGVGPSCTMLRPDGTCRAYEIRPMICRLWGLMKSMACPYGCKPDRWLTDAEAFMFLTRADEIGGSPTDRDRRLYEQVKLQADALGPEEWEKYAREVAKHSVVSPSLAGRSVTPPGIANKRTGVNP